MNEKENYILNDKGKVIYYHGCLGRYYPYRWDRKLKCWNECSGVYGYKYLRQLEKNGKVQFFD